MPLPLTTRSIPLFRGTVTKNPNSNSGRRRRRPWFCHLGNTKYGSQYEDPLQRLSFFSCPLPSLCRFPFLSFETHPWLTNRNNPNLNLNLRSKSILHLRHRLRLRLTPVEVIFLSPSSFSDSEGFLSTRCCSMKFFVCWVLLGIECRFGDLLGLGGSDLNSRVMGLLFFKHLRLMDLNILAMGMGELAPLFFMIL